MMKSPLLLVVVHLTLMAVTVVTLPAGAVRAQESADLSLEQQIQAALANAGFDPGPADGKFGPKTRTAIQAWQRANGHADTGFLTRDQLGSILTGTTTAALEPKCAELPGRYLGENHAECWVEIANRPGCFLWRTHYHSDQTTRWTGLCHRGVAKGHGTYSVSAGSEHSAYEGTGTLANGEPVGRWVDEWADGTRYEGEYRDGKWHGYGTFTWADGGRYEGEWRNGKANGHGMMTWSDGNRVEGEWRNGCFDQNGWQTWFFSDKETCGFE